MRTFKLCRLWCDHGELCDDGDWMLCARCGCPLELQEGYWDPKQGREEECDCPECRRDFWGNHPVVGFPPPWRDEDELLRMWRSNAISWVKDLGRMFGQPGFHGPGSDALIRAMAVADVVLFRQQGVPDPMCLKRLNAVIEELRKGSPGTLSVESIWPAGF